MQIGNAPVSWGIFEVAGLSATIPYQQVLDEIATAGYEGTELGPWGFYPTDPATLQAELTRRHLALASAFCPVDLADPANHANAASEVHRVANLLQALGARQVILADPQRPSRARVAGRAGPADEMSPAQWQATIAGVRSIAEELAGRGLEAVFHHHVATYLETSAEIDHLLTATPPGLLGLCLDTGHAVFGGADPVAVLRRWGERVRYVHLKDVDARALARVRAEALDYESAVRAGVFCPLGQGCVDFAGVFDELRRIGYDGWLIVEQDVVVDESGQRSSAGLTPLEAARQSRSFLRAMLGR